MVLQPITNKNIIAINIQLQVLEPNNLDLYYRPSITYEEFSALYYLCKNRNLRCYKKGNELFFTKINE